MRTSKRHLVLCRGLPGLVVAALLLLLVSACGSSGDRAAPAPPPAPPPGAAGPSAPADELDVRAENARPGAAWSLARPAAPNALSGWLDAVSVLPGERTRLFVSTVLPSFRVTAFRFGWYGGTDARIVYSSGPIRGVRQPAPRVLAPTSTVTAASWTPSLTLDTTGWPVGDYLLRLDGSDGTGRYVPLTVRGASATGRLVVLNAVTTWAAYDAYGGYSLYHGPDGAFATRARAVTFDRPYDYGDGSGDFVGNERPLVQLVERLGLPVDYATDVDLHRDPHLLDGALGVLSLGHDEYYSPAMRTALTTARDRGASVAFLGANAVYRRIRFGSTALGTNRLEIGYKVAGEDPLLGKDDAQVTANWPDPPAASPQSSLTGGMYQCNPVHADLVLTGYQPWLLAGSGAAAGTRVPGLVGSEYDRIDRAVPTPSPIDAVAHSPLTCHGRPDFADVSWYSTPSGAGVFDAGTSAWVCALDDACAAGAGGPDTRRIITAVTSNLLQAMAAGQAGRAHPA